MRRAAPGGGVQCRAPRLRGRPTAPIVDLEPARRPVAAGAPMSSRPAPGSSDASALLDDFEWPPRNDNVSVHEIDADPWTTAPSPPRIEAGTFASGRTARMTGSAAAITGSGVR